MRMVFCFSGKTDKGPIRDIVEDYRNRISKYVQVEIIEAKNLKPQERSGIHIILSPDGKSMTSEKFASFIEKSLMHGTKHMFFYTGGPSGLSNDIVNNADDSISLSAMTFNHQLIRAMLLEQVYRGFTIIKGEPYHK